jgi:hypothetical protein
VKGLIQHCLKRAGRWAAAPVAVLAGLGAHGAALAVLGGLVIALAVLACLMWRWTLASTARSDRGIRMILALRGDPRSLPQRPSPQPPPGSPRHRPSPPGRPTVKATLTSRARSLVTRQKV